MRIGGGALRGRAVKVAPGVRPTGGRAREALFDLWGGRLRGSRFLDLFAGSGAVGLEALSRGAAACVAVERAGPAFETLRANYRRLAPPGTWRLERLSLPAGLGRRALAEGGPFDLIWADPPYDFACWQELLAGIAPLLAASGEAAVEHGRRNRPPEEAPGLSRRDRRAYGETEISFYSAPLPERPR